MVTKPARASSFKWKELARAGHIELMRCLGQVAVIDISVSIKMQPSFHFWMH